MELLVVRHAHAGAKDRWRGEDRLRPLSARGRREAFALVDLLAPYEPLQVVSSPFVRCLQTVEPLATHLGLAIEESETLGPQADSEAVQLLRSLASARHGVVVSTHGETIEALQRRLVRPGKLAFGPGGAHEKGSVWLLHAKGRRFSSATYLPPGLPPSGGHSAGGHSAGGHSAGGHSAGGHSAGGHSAGGHSAGGHSAGGHSAGGHSAGGHSAGGHPSEGRHALRAVQEAGDEAKV